MKENELVTPSEAENAIETMAGQVWENAVSQAELELDKSSNPTNLVTMMMQPALWWTIPSNIAKGTPEKMSPLPITRTGQTMKELGRDTFMEPITDAVGGLLAGPETAIRKKADYQSSGNGAITTLTGCWQVWRPAARSAQTMRGWRWSTGRAQHSRKPCSGSPQNKACEHQAHWVLPR
jgi:hypothetical protein